MLSGNEAEIETVDVGDGGLGDPGVQRGGGYQPIRQGIRPYLGSAEERSARGGCGAVSILVEIGVPFDLHREAMSM